MNKIRLFSILLLLFSKGPCLDSELVVPGKSQGPPTAYFRTGIHQRGKALGKRSTNSRLPEIITQSGEITVIEGETAELVCEVTSLGSFILMWKEAKRVISAGELMVRKDSRFRLSVVDNSYILNIERVRREDSGQYICEVDILGRPLRVTQKLEVLVPPQVQPRERDILLMKGQNYTLSCSGQGYPNPRITWTRQDGYLSDTEIDGLSLSIHKADRHSAGMYVCTASNGVSPPAKATISVVVKYPPEVEMEQTWMRSDHGVEVEIDCIVHSNPPSQVTWFKESGKIFETDRVLMTEKTGRWSVKIIGLRESDFGNYSCRAENGLGKGQQYLDISGRPSPPKFTSQAVNFQPGSYNLTWSAEAFSAVTEYKLRYRQSKGPSVTSGDPEKTVRSGTWSEVVMPVPEHLSSQSYILRELLPGTVYDVVGYAKNKYGWSRPSSVFTFFNKGVDFSTQELIKAKEREKERLENVQKTKTELTPLISSGVGGATVSALLLAINLLL